MCVCRLQPFCIKSLNKKEVIHVSAGAHHSIALTAQSQVRLSALNIYGIYFELLTVYLKIKSFKTVCVCVCVLSRCIRGAVTSPVNWDTWTRPAPSPVLQKSVN